MLGNVNVTGLVEVPMGMSLREIVYDIGGGIPGDHALKALTQTARIILRDADIFGRLGGEEFAIILPETNLVSACHVAERLR